MAFQKWMSKLPYPLPPGSDQTSEHDDERHAGGESAGVAGHRGAERRTGFVLAGGDLATLLRSIRDVLFSFPDDAVVHSGHGPDTTIGAERRR